MVRPAAFGFNAETAVNNSFQHTSALSPQQIELNALNEFDSLVNLLRAKGITVQVLHDTPQPVKPDAVFPNNWFSTHSSGKLILYPMYAPVRRLERREGIQQLFPYKKLIDLHAYEQENKFLEGTGSLVFDHKNKVAYAGLSVRTHQELVTLVASQLGYSTFVFNTADKNGNAIYHTNVMLSISDELAVVCLACVTDKAEALHQNLIKGGKKIIEISMQQMENFCGNCLVMQNAKGERYMVMSETAKQNFTAHQLQAMQQYYEILAVPLNTIESIGGGSARCMLAEIF